VLDIRDFLDGLIFNVLIGNADAHGKNYSFLYQGSDRRLAPFYDLVCTLAWPELSKTPAMKIGESDSIERVTPAHWKEMTDETRLGWPMVRERIAELCKKTAAALREPNVRSAAGNEAMFERVAGIIAERVASLLQRLA
jgi:serine/threonine-protein kinase HipA